MNRVEDLLQLGVKEVLGTMFNVEPLLDASRAMIQSDLQIAGAVGFIGDLTGVVYLYSSESLVRQLASRMLGIEESEVDGGEMVNDTVGELANMIVGYAKTKLSEQGLSCVLTIPSFVRGSQFCVETTSSTTRRVFAFRCDQHQLWVEIMLRPADGPTTT